jgi:hypothetical protein
MDSEPIASARIAICPCWRCFWLTESFAGTSIYYGWRCISCGEIIDLVILSNRHRFTKAMSVEVHVDGLVENSKTAWSDSDAYDCRYLLSFFTPLRATV